LPKPETHSASTPARCSARLLERSPGAEAVERVVGLKAARAFLADLQAHARKCEAQVLASGAGAALWPVAASIVRFIDMKLLFLDPPALRQSLVPPSVDPPTDAGNGSAGTALGLGKGGTR
jgi:hypothetical protein